MRVGTRRILGPGSRTPSTLPNGLMAYYAQENVNDGSGNGRTLTNNNGVTFRTGQVVNGAFYNNAGLVENQTLSRIDSAFALTTFTLACWFKLAATYVATKTLVSRRVEGGGDTHQGYSLAITGGEEPVIGVSDGVTQVSKSWGAAIVAGTWYSLIAWCSTAEIGVTLNNGTPQTTTGHTAGDGGVFCLGATNELFDLYYGDLDEVMVANRVWTATERTYYHSRTSAGLSPL